MVKKLHHMEIHPAHNGGHTVKHFMEHSMKRDGKSHSGISYLPPEEEHHVFAEHEGHEMLAHIANHLDIPSMPREEEEPDRSDYPSEHDEEEGKE